MARNEKTASAGIYRLSPAALASGDPPRLDRVITAMALLIDFLIGIVVLIVLAGLLRLTWLGHLNFRNDESFTLLDARQSWLAVLGFDGFYDYPPPLSFALAKAAALIVPEVLAARAVAAVS